MSSNKSAKSQKVPTVKEDEKVSIPGTSILHLEHKVSIGPLPPPEVLQEYGEIGVLDDVLQLARDSSKRKDMVLESDLEDSRIERLEFAKDHEQERHNQKVENFMFLFAGIVLTVVLLICMGVAIAFIWYEKWIGATGFGLTGIILLAKTYASYSLKRGKK